MYRVDDLRGEALSSLGAEYRGLGLNPGRAEVRIGSFVNLFRLVHLKKIG